ncbi:MAG TPA: hypothetical protein VFP93_05340 [Gammaproteobacteria bacterium]|nr:hypothetical protein [Gammaproteobacteria bacterium]
MKFEELEPAEVPLYNPALYHNIRQAIEQEVNKSPNKIIYSIAIHLSFCVQNLHKNMEKRLRDLLEYHNSHNGKLPSEIYFEPSRPNIFPPPPKKPDDLPHLNKLLVHHANFYPMKSMRVTWAYLVTQYLETLAFSIENKRLNECLQNGQDGCFDKCISDMGEWKTLQTSMATAKPGL